MIGLIFGETDFPKYILKKIKKKHKYLIIDLTKKKFFKKDKNSFSVSIVRGLTDKTLKNDDIFSCSNWGNRVCWQLSSYEITRTWAPISCFHSQS